MISVVCIYNNNNILSGWLLKSLERQASEYELIKIDNAGNIFKSAAEALNYGGKKAKGKYIMFVHQDVDLCSSTWLENTEKILDSIPDLGVAGVVGANEEGEHNIIKQDIPPVWLPHIPIQKPKQVQTIDESLVIIPKAVFDMLPFDENACDDWHLYAVDYCLSIRKLEFGAYAIPMSIYHKSAGTLTNKYYKVLKKLLKKHGDDYKTIYTTCGAWITSRSLILQRIEGVVRRKPGLRYLWRKLLKNE